MKMKVFLVIAFLAPSVFGADHNVYKNCSRTFCAELRNPLISEEEFYGATLIEGSDTPEFNLTKNGSNQTLRLSIIPPSYFDDNGVYRIQIDDPENPRYKLKHVLRDEIFESSKKHHSNLRIAQDKEKYTIVGADDDGPTRLEVTYGPPFVITFYKNLDELQMTLNGSSFLWQEDTGHFTFDVTFESSKVLYGLFHHADTMVLRETADGSTDPYRLRNSDNFEYEVNSTMALYGSAPVIYGHSSNGTSGLFLHNAAEQWVDISYDGPPAARFMVDTGAFDLFVLLGPTPSQTVKQLTYLTGLPHLPQLWTLGYHQSRWSYYTQEEVEDVVTNMDKYDFPIDAVWLDIDYTDGKRYFTWNPENFSDPLDLQKKINDTGRKLVVILDPHIKVEDSYFVYALANEQGLFVKNPDGSNFEGDCWPGLASYLDFLNDNTTEFYAGLYSYDSFVNTTGVIAGVWNDMNEPSVFDNTLEKTLPFNTTHVGGVEHRNVHNIYGFLQTRATHLGLLRRDNSTRRPFVLTRSHFVGSQRYAAMWTGDNTASWAHLAVSFSECLTAGVVGQAWCGADVGGFHNIPDDELAYRWYQAGAWLPFFRGHSEENQPRREPYRYPEDVQEIIRQAIKLRYRHITQWYTLFFEHTRTGEPVIRPLFYHYPEDSNTFDIANQLLVGSDILVRQVAEPNTTSVSVYFPGTDQFWYQANDDTVHQGGRWENVDVNKTFIPVYYRAGSIIVRKETPRKNTKDMESDPIDVFVYLDQNQTANGTLYFDDFTSFNFQNNKEYGYYSVQSSENGTTVMFTGIDDISFPPHPVQVKTFRIYSLPENSTKIAEKRIVSHTAEGKLLENENLTLELHRNKKITLKL